MLFKYPPPWLRAKIIGRGGDLNRIERTVKIFPLSNFICQILSLQRYLPGDSNSPLLLNFLIVIFFFNILVFRTRELFVNIVKTTPPPSEIFYVK